MSLSSFVLYYQRIQNSRYTVLANEIDILVLVLSLLLKKKLKMCLVRLFVSFLHVFLLFSFVVVVFFIVHFSFILLFLSTFESVFKKLCGLPVNVLKMKSIFFSPLMEFLKKLQGLLTHVSKTKNYQILISSYLERNASSSMIQSQSVLDVYNYH